MTCRCSANALRLFVRTVAQVDIPAGSSSFHSLHQRPQAATRNFSRYRALPSQRRTNSTLAPGPVSANSIEPETSNTTIASRPTPAESTEPEECARGEAAATNDQPVSTIEEIRIESALPDGFPRIPSESPHSKDGPQSKAESGLSATVQLDSAEHNRPPQRDPESRPAADLGDLDSAFVDFSAEAIDAMAAEVATAKPMPEPAPIFEKEEISSTAERSQRDDEKDLASSLRALGLSPGRKGMPKPSFKISYSSSLEPVPIVDDWVPPKKEPWQIQKARLKEKFPEGWNPLKKLSPDAMVGIRQLHAQMPEKYTTGFLADHFKVSPDSIRRILKSKWQPDADTQVNKDMRWFRRGERVWSRYAELGVKPPRRWRDEGIGRGKPEWKKKKDPKHSPRVVPALMTTTRRAGGYFGNDGSSSDTKSSGIPELVTTKRPDH